MKLEDLTTDYEQRKVFTYAADGNTVVKHNKMMRKIGESIYAGEPESDGWNTVCNIYVCFDGIERGFKAGSVSTGYDVDEVIAWIKRGEADTTDNILAGIKKAIEDGRHIPLIHAYFVQQFKPELVPEIMEARKKYEERLEQKRRERMEREAAEEAEYVKRGNEEAENKVAAALEILRNGGTLKNETVEFYKSRYEYSAYSIVNYLCRKYGVKLPLRTAGWVNDCLANLIIKDGKCESLQYYKRSKTTKASEVIYSYINSLIEKVKEA